MPPTVEHAKAWHRWWAEVWLLTSTFSLVVAHGCWRRADNALDPAQLHLLDFLGFVSTLVAAFQAWHAWRNWTRLRELDSYYGAP